VVIRFGLAALLAVGLLACNSQSGPTSGPSGSSGAGEFRDTGPSGGSAAGAYFPGSSPGLTTIYFDFDQSNLRADAKNGLKANADFMKSNATASVLIEGNCDERGSEEYNLALGMRRAEAAKRYLVDLGVESSRLSTISYGEERPAASGSGESAWAKNRRDDFKVR
jgi:peptidoglycan-associated lipoprotein